MITLKAISEIEDLITPIQTKLTANKFNADIFDLKNFKAEKKKIYENIHQDYIHSLIKINEIYFATASRDSAIKI